MPAHLDLSGRTEINLLTRSTMPAADATNLSLSIYVPWPLRVRNRGQESPDYGYINHTDLIKAGSFVMVSPGVTIWCPVGSEEVRATSSISVSGLSEALYGYALEEEMRLDDGGNIDISVVQLTSIWCLDFIKKKETQKLVKLKTIKEQQDERERIDSETGCAVMQP